MMRWKINFWDLFFGMLGLAGITILFLVMISAIRRSVDNDNAMQQYKSHSKLSDLSSFYIYYKEGKKERVESESCIYGQTDDKIYFLTKSGRDTVKVVPQIEVEKVTTLDPTKVK